MPEDGSPRPRPMRRLLLAMARAVILLILITGIYGALTIALPRPPAANRAVAALVIGVIIFETLRATRRPASSAIGTGNESRIAALSDAVEKARTSAADQAQEIQRLREQIEPERARASSIEGRLASTQQELEAIRAERANLQKLVADYENDLVRSRESARALEGLLASAQGELEAVRAERADLQNLVAGHENDLERERERASSLEGRLASALQELEGLRGERLKLEKLATDHENDHRDAIAARDAGRAELRSVTGKLRDAEQEPELTPAISFDRVFRPTRYSGPYRPGPREVPKPTKGQSAIEYVLFGVFGVLFLLAAIALYAMYSPKHRLVPNLVAQGLEADRVNILVFGIGGSGHPTQDQLADSIVLISLKPSTKQAAIVSIPRDLWVRMGRFGTHRINYANQAGEMSGYPGEGAGLLCDTVSRTFNQPIHAFVRVDFAAFEKIVDQIGGVDVFCERSFYDFLFKDGFVRGWHHLDGKRALAYARYRYVIGPEGDNFARELRQQQVISAVRDKLQKTSPQTAFRLIQAASTLSSSSETNLTTTQMIQLYRMFHDIPQSQVRHVSLKPVTELFNVTRLAEPGIAVRTRTDDGRELQGLEANIFRSEREIRTPDQIDFSR